MTFRIKRGPTTKPLLRGLCNQFADAIANDWIIPDPATLDAAAPAHDSSS
jgi:hypothetical protein